MRGIEIVKNWPQWMACYNSPASGSFLNQYIMQGGIVQYANLEDDIYSLRNKYTFYEQPRGEWLVETDKLESDNLTITYHTAISSGTATRCQNRFDFDRAITPCFFLDGFIIRFRNLDVVSTTTTPGSGYTVDIPAIVPDSSIWYLAGRYYERATERSPLTLTRRKETTLWYRSLELYTQTCTGSIRINDGPGIPLTRYDTPNWWDTLGNLESLYRFNDESNSAIAARAKARGYVGKTTGSRAIVQNLAVDSDNITAISWATSGTLTLADYGITNATRIWVYEVPQYQTINEVPRRVGYNTYRLLGVPESSLFYLGTIPASASSNTLTTLRDTDTVEVLYRIKSYDLVTSGRYIVSVVPVSGNLMSDIVTVYVSRGVSNSTLYESYLSTLSTDMTISLSTYIHEKVGVTLGYTTWNRSPWFIEEEDKPEMSFILDDLE